MENKFINCGEVLYMPSLKKYNTYNVDSSVKFLIFPNDINELKNTLKIASENNLKTKISIDGGVNETNIDILKEKKVDILVSSSYLLKGDINNKVKYIKGY